MPGHVRLGDVERRGHGDGRIRGVAAALQDIEPDLRRERLAGRHHAVAERTTDRPARNPEYQSLAGMRPSPSAGGASGRLAARLPRQHRHHHRHGKRHHRRDLVFHWCPRAYFTDVAHGRFASCEVRGSGTLVPFGTFLPSNPELRHVRVSVPSQGEPDVHCQVTVCSQPSCSRSPAARPRISSPRPLPFRRQGRDRVYELRTYTAAPGKFDALNARFRDHTVRIFAKHGVKNIIYWTPTEGPLVGNTLIYVIPHASREAAEKFWKNSWRSGMGQGTRPRPSWTARSRPGQVGVHDDDGLFGKVTRPGSGSGLSLQVCS